MKSLQAQSFALAALLLSPLVYTVSAEHAHHRAKIIHHKRHAQPEVNNIDSDAARVVENPLPVNTIAHPHAHPRYKHQHKAVNTEAASSTKTTVKEVRIRTIYLNDDSTPSLAAASRFHSRTRDIEDEQPLPTEEPLDYIDEPELSLSGNDEFYLQDPAVDANDSDREVTMEPQLELRSPKMARILQPRQEAAYRTFRLGDNPVPSSTISAAAAGASDLCPHANGTTFKTKAGITYQVVCNIDFPGNDYRFQKTGNLEECVARCDTFNYISHHALCLAAIWVPSRINYANDCYLKSSVAVSKYTALEIHGLVRLSAIKASTSDSAPAAEPTQASEGNDNDEEDDETSTDNSPTDPPTDNGGSNTPRTGNEPGVTYASGQKIVEPRPAGNRLHGPTKNKPTKQYIDYDNPEGISLANNLLNGGINDILTSGYDVSLDTGILALNSSTQPLLESLDGTPHMSRDGGQGGYLNGQHLFLFCDTGSYTEPSDGQQGRFVGFVSSSVAVDTGMNGLNSEPIILQDGIGQWYGANGRQRGFAPLTQGELAYNLKKQGGGLRYAIWPESPIIPIDGRTGIIYAPIVYTNVDRQSNIHKYTYTGATLLTITADNKAGPIATRTVNKIFEQDEIEWGCGGGIRGWGADGIGGDEGLVYIFGNTRNGILLARTRPENIADRESFEYWDGNTWTKQMLAKTATSYFIKGNFMDVNLFYSPRHLTFIMVYLTVYADNTFYYRYLKADHAILPPYVSGGDANYVENIHKYPWSDRQILYKAPPSKSGKYIYAGGMHDGYYGSNDITNGGTRMLLSWTAPTGENPASQDSEYQILTAEVEWQ